MKLSLVFLTFLTMALLQFNLAASTCQKLNSDAKKVYKFVMDKIDPNNPLSSKEITEKTGLDSQLVNETLDTLSTFDIEYLNPELRGVRQGVVYDKDTTWKKVFGPMSWNEKGFKDYDIRMTEQGGIDLSPKNMGFLTWGLINMVEKREQAGEIINDKTVLICTDGRLYYDKMLESAIYAAQIRGYQVIFAKTKDGGPMNTSVYSFATRQINPTISMFVTASHISRPINEIVVGTKNAIMNKNGTPTSITTAMIKSELLQNIYAMMKDSKLGEKVIDFEQLKSMKTHEVDQAHTDMILLGILAANGLIENHSLFEVDKLFRKSPKEIDNTVSTLLKPFKSIPQILKGVKITIEAFNTSSGYYSRRPLEMLGAEVVPLNEKVILIQGEHNADPSLKKNVEYLTSEMINNNSHFGLAYDADGDRLLLLVNKGNGEVYEMAPDKISQLLKPYLVKEGGYSKAEKLVFTRDVLSTDGILDQAKEIKESNVLVETTDAGYINLNEVTYQRTSEGYTSLGQGEASGHGWLGYTGNFENPIFMGTLFISMLRSQIESNKMTLEAPYKAVMKSIIPYRKSPRFQPLFSQSVLKKASESKANDTGWKIDSKDEIPSKIIGLCRNESVLAAEKLFPIGSEFSSPWGNLTVTNFEKGWNDYNKIFGFGKIYFATEDGVPFGSFVTRGSSSGDPTAVQVWEVREFKTKSWEGKILSEKEIEKRFSFLGGLVLSKLGNADIIEISDRSPSKNMNIPLESYNYYNSLQSTD